MASRGTILELNPAKGMFILALDDGLHSLWTLYSHTALAVGDSIEGRLDQMGSEWLMPQNRQHFEGFGETGSTTLAECRRLMWG